MRERAGFTLIWGTLGAIPPVFFLLVEHNPLLTVAAIIVEVGLFTAVQLALRPPATPRPPGPRLGTPRDPRPRRRSWLSGR